MVLVVAVAFMTWLCYGGATRGIKKGGMGGQSLHFQSKQLRGGEQREAEGRKAGGGVEVGS